MTGLLLLISLLLVLLNGFFVAAEFALVRAKASHFVDGDEQDSRRSKRALFEIEHIDSYLSACQLGITMASIGLGFAGEPAFSALLEPIFEPLFGASATTAISITLAFFIITVLHIIIGELAPKSFAIAAPEPVARWVSEPLHLFHVIFRPFIWTLNSIAGRLVRLFGVQPVSELELGTTGDDLRMIVAHAQMRKTLDAGEAHMLSGVFELHEHEARQVMTPIPAVVTVDV
ncbi:MAG: DUF21 domain-containing protein, partial [Thermoleophilaceae bacterium]|nr:DUF21 domain-containing protein [Thermoleophilaceae bacterium]